MVNGSGTNGPVVSDAELSMGMNVFHTTTKGIGGKLRKRVEDFVVDEVSFYPPEINDPARGRFTVATVCAVNWETNRLIRQLSRQLGIRLAQVHFSGTKDKRAVTTQLMTFEAPPEKVLDIKLPDVKISGVYTSNVRLKLGRLYGNRFDILLSSTDIKGDELKSTITETRTQLEALKGFPNYFGVQRFGAVRPVTHTVGKYIAERKFKEAVWEYIGHPMKSDVLGFEARTNLIRTRDLEAALAEFPKDLEFERMIIRHLIKEPEDYVGAIRTLPQNLLSMLVHAYQSYLFNQILSERMSRGISVTEPGLGDLVLAVDKNGLPIHTEWFMTTLENHSKLRNLVARQRAFISGLVFGTDTQFADGVQGEIEHRIIESEGLKPDDFVIPELLSTPSHGIRRELVAPVKSLDIEIHSDSARFKFQLNKGTYATSLMREYMKAGASNY